MHCLQALPAGEQCAARRAAPQHTARESAQILSVDHEGEGMPRSEHAWSLEEPDEEGGWGPSRASVRHLPAAAAHTGAERQGSAMLSMHGAAQPFRDCSRPSTGSAQAGPHITRQGSSGAPSVADQLGVLSQGDGTLSQRGAMPGSGGTEHGQIGSRPSGGASRITGLLAQGASGFQSSAGHLGVGSDRLSMPSSRHVLGEVQLPAGAPVTGVAGTALLTEMECAAHAAQALRRGPDPGLPEQPINVGDQLPRDNADVSGRARDLEGLLEDELPIRDAEVTYGQQRADTQTWDGQPSGNLGTLEGPASSLHAESGCANSLRQAQQSAQAQHAADLLHVRSKIGRAPGQGPFVEWSASSAAASTGITPLQANAPSVDQGGDPPQAFFRVPSAALLQGKQRAGQAPHGLSTRAAQLSAQQGGLPGGLPASDCIFPGSLGSISSLSGAGQHSTELQAMQARAEPGGSATIGMPIGRQETTEGSPEAQAVSAAAQNQGIVAIGAPGGSDEPAASHQSEGSAMSAAPET